LASISAWSAVLEVVTFAVVVSLIVLLAISIALVWLLHLK
jgi:hypothetical protein